MTGTTSRATAASAIGRSGLVRQRPGRPLLARIIKLLQTYQRRSIQRRELRALDERALRDIGLTRADVQYECSKPFWQD